MKLTEILKEKGILVDQTKKPEAKEPRKEKLGRRYFWSEEETNKNRRTNSKGKRG